MSISLKRIVEQQGTGGQYYDLGLDFANFKRMIDGSSDQIKQRFEQVIGAKLNGKRIRARASRGYKQYVKDYEFDVSRVTLDDYYDNYVVVAHDNSTPKPKEYFLKPGFKIQILGSAGDSGQATNSVATQTQPEKPVESPSIPSGNKPMEVKEEDTKKEDESGYYDAYSVDSITQDVKNWLPTILKKPETALRDFVKGLGWMKEVYKGKVIALFDLKIPVDSLKIKLTPQLLKDLLMKASMGNEDRTITTKYTLMKAVPDEQRENVLVRIKKTITDNSAYE